MNAALNAVLVNVAQVLTGRTLVTVLSSVLLVLLCIADTLAAAALAVARADFVRLWIDAVILTDLTAAVRPTPAVVADTVAALAGSVLRASAHFSIISVAAKIVALTELSADLFGCISRVALTDAASTR